MMKTLTLHILTIESVTTNVITNATWNGIYIVAKQ